MGLSGSYFYPSVSATPNLGAVRIVPNLSSSTILSGNMSASQVSTNIDLNTSKGYSVQVVFSGSDNTGSIRLDASCDNGTDWTAVSDSTFTILGSGSHVYNVSNVYYQTARLAYTVTQGTGSLTAYVIGKG